MRDDWDGAAAYLQTIDIKCDRLQRTCGRVYKMAARNVVSMGAASHQDLLLSCVEVEHRDLRRIESAIGSNNRKEDGIAVGNHLRPQVSAFPLRPVRAGENSGLTVIEGHFLEANALAPRARIDDGV